MIVSHAEKVVADVFQEVAVAGRCAKGIGVRTSTLGADAIIAQRTFQVSYRDVCPLQHLLGVLEEVFAIVGGQ